MLNRLSVCNLAVVERADAEFSSGLNVLTGETGAGKSVLMGALELVLGGRADSDVVRDGADEARVEAFFELSGKAKSSVAAILGDLGLEPLDGGALTIRRTVSSDGRSRAWANDSPVTAATLKRLGKALVDIHGPRANQNILEEHFQRETLDAYSEASVLRDYGAAYAAWRAVVAEMEALRGESATEDELEMLRFQVGELTDAALTDEDETLSERHAAAAHAEEAMEDAGAITEGLGGDQSAAEILVRLQPHFRDLAKRLPEAAEWATEAEDLTVRIQELSRRVADAVSALDAGEESLEELDARLTAVNRLKRKYLKGADAADAGAIGRLLALLDKKRARLAALESRDARLAELAAAAAKAEAKVRATGEALTACRRTAGAKVAKAVTKELRDLGFAQAKFAVAIEPIAPEAHGLDRVTYMFEPNPGEAARPLAAIASSGETARVMLALKGVLAAHDATDVLVFDEIDANVGGEIGRAVGEKMRRLARGRQVVAITHLPQSAAYGERHLVVSKAVAGGRTRTKISEVSGEARVKEIARMLGGETLTSVVKKHAEELLSLSR